MPDINIFESATPQSGEFFKFKNVGDAVQGTYIDKKHGTDSYNNLQTIYVIKDSDGKIWNLGFKDSSVILHERMAGIHMGQIVGFKYDEERESKNKPGLNKAKIIRVYADPKFVDTAWLDEQKRLADLFGSAAPKPTQQTHTVSEVEEEDEDGDQPPFSQPVGNTGDLQAPSEKSPEIEFASVYEFANTKGLTSSSMSVEDAKNVIESYAELPLNAENVSKIIMKIVNYKSA